jgi:hypothetical protein
MALPEKGLCSFDFYEAGSEVASERLDGEIVACSRILDELEVLCVLNFYGSEKRSADDTGGTAA